MTAKRATGIIEADGAGAGMVEKDLLLGVLRGRVATYQLLSRLFRVEVDEDLYGRLLGMRFPANTGNKLVDEGYRMIRDYLSEATEAVITELAVDYVRAFVGSGNSGYSAAYPFESVYTSPKRLLMQDARDEVLVLYRAAGVTKSESWNEGEDHLALELEFVQILGERALDAMERGDEEACASNLLQSVHFLEDHLCAWYPMMARDLEHFPRTKFYRGLGKLTEGYLESDRELLLGIVGREDGGAAIAASSSPAGAEA